MTFRNWGWINKGVAFQETEDMKTVKELEKNAQQFMTDIMEFNSREAVFKELLTHKIRLGADQVGKQTIQTLWQQFPFLFGPSTLPAQMKLLVFSAKRGDIFVKTEPQALKSVDADSYDMTVYEGIYQSLKYGKPYLMAAYDQYTKIRRYVRTTSEEQKARDLAQLQAYKNSRSMLGRFADYAVKPVVWGWSLIKEFDASLFQTNNAGQFFQQTINKAKIYGSVIVNCAYLQKYGLKENANGQILITDPLTPSLRFQVVNGSLTVYLFDDGKLIEIKQSDFTLKFLQNLLKGIYLKRSGNVIKTFNSYMDPSADNVQRKMQFQEYFYTPAGWGFFRAEKPYKTK